MSDSYYDTAQICRNGHVVNSMAYDYPQSNQKYCDKCGKETLTSCPACNEKIRCYYHVPGVIAFPKYSAPSYCHNCGQAYPWTASSIEAANELADEFGVSAERIRQIEQKAMQKIKTLMLASR